MNTTATSLAPLRAAPAWHAADLESDLSWTIRLDEDDRQELLGIVRAARDEKRDLLSWRRQDFPFDKSLKKLGQAFREAQLGRGVALIKGLPREGVSPEEFELMTWAIGLHFGVARPQDKLSRYMNQVRDAGTDYRSATGRGYSSNAELDFHIDGADVVVLSCYNQAENGGDSMCCSSLAAFEALRQERPDLAEALQTAYPWSRQGEEAEGASPFHLMPVYGVEGDLAFCSWNRNRLENALKMPGTPGISPLQREAVTYLDALIRRPEFMYSMRLEAGDLQILSNHTVLHSRTGFRDHSDPARKRTLYRLWLSTPEGPRLPAAWRAFFGTTEPGVVRGGIYGHHYDERCRSFDRSQAHDVGMRYDEECDKVWS
jgi:hypothetical protein